MTGTAPSDRVAVVGNGPVGQTTALLLARWGVPVVLLDRRPARDPVGSKAICQQRDVLDIWEAVGAGRRIADEGVTWTTARTFYRDRELFADTLPDQGRSCFPPFVNLSQSRTEEILDERIAGQPLIDVRWGCEVTGIEQDTDGVTLDCGGATIRAPYAVVCAGARAEPLREALGVSFEGGSFDDRFLICDIRTDLPGWRTERRFYFDPRWNPGRQVLIHPCPGSCFRIDWQVGADYDLEAEVADGGLDARVRAIIGDVDYEIEWKSVYRFHSRVADRLCVGRVLLAGDAAHLFSPFGARGLNSGVADAENAAWKLAFVLHGSAPESLVDTYHDERHAAALENLDVTSATMRFLVPHGEVERSHRAGVLERAVTDPGARSEVDSGRLSEPFWYTGSRLTTSDPSRPFPGRPARGATPPVGPGVIVPDGPLRVSGKDSRVREVARDGFLLLAVGDRDRETAERAARGVAAPVTVLELGEADRTGTVAAALGARPGEIWVIRPDAHIAAVARGDAVLPALRRALGLAGHPREGLASF